METKMNKYGFLPNILKMVFITPVQWLRLQNDEEAVEIAMFSLKSPILSFRNQPAVDIRNPGSPDAPGYRISTPSRPV